MFLNLDGNEPTSKRSGLKASIAAAFAADSICASADLSISFLPHAIIIEGVVEPTVAIRAKEIVSEIASSSMVLDQMIWRRTADY